MRHLLHSSALVAKVSDDDSAENRSTRLVGVQNPAGCFVDDLGSFARDGVANVEDLKRILKEGVGLLKGGSSCRDNNKNVTWCAEPSADQLLGEQDREWYAELVNYLKNEFAQTDQSLPIVAAVWDKPLGADAKSAQIMNMVCGFERLGMSKRFVLFATTGKAHDSFASHFLNTINVFHPHVITFADAMRRRTNVQYYSRIMKLVVAQLVLDTGRDVIITDTDISWIRDSSEVLHKSGLDFAAMADVCAHDINSGFVYYRNVPKTRDLLHMSLSTWRESWICADNDQYVLNCGHKRAAIKGLNYKVLPSNSWSLKCSGHFSSCICRESSQLTRDTSWQQMFGIGDGYPYIVHTFGMSTDYESELDFFAALDMVDMDFRSGQCYKGPKEMVTSDTLRKSCSTSEDGILHAMCYGSCKKEPVRAKTIIADLRATLSAPTAVVHPSRGPVSKHKGKPRSRQERSVAARKDDKEAHKADK